MSGSTLREQLLEHPPCGCGPETVCAAHRASPEPEYPRDNAIARAIVQVWPDHRTRPTMHEALAFLQQLEAAGFDSKAMDIVRGFVVQRERVS
jgi:hypothetical protein